MIRRIGPVSEVRMTLYPRHGGRQDILGFYIGSFRADGHGAHNINDRSDRFKGSLTKLISIQKAGYSDIRMSIRYLLLKKNGAKASAIHKLGKAEKLSIAF